MREYLAVLDDSAFGVATPVTPKQLAVADPTARWTAASRERAFFAQLPIRRGARTSRRLLAVNESESKRRFTIRDKASPTPRMFLI